MAAPYTLHTETFGNAPFSYALQNKVATLWDGSLIYLHDTAAATTTLYQVTNPAGTSPTDASVQTFSITSSTQQVGDIFVVDNGNSSNDVWVAVFSNSGVAGAHVRHATYSSSGVWTWDTETSCLGDAGQTINNLGGIVWTGGSGSTGNLVVAFRGAKSANATQVIINYTQTKAGTSGWQSTTLALASTTGTSASDHYYPTLHYDSTLDIIACVYILKGDSIVSRVLGVASSTSTIPTTIGNWSSEVTAVPGNISCAAGFNANLDHTTGRLHLVYEDATAGAGHAAPGYNSCTFGGTNNATATWGTAFSIATASSTTIRDVQVLIDGNGTSYVLWSTAGAGANSVIDYVSIASPYGSANVSGITTFNHANTATNDYCQVRTQTRGRANGGYAPLFWVEGTATPWNIQFDNTLSIGVQSTAWAKALGPDAISETDTLTTLKGTGWAQSLGPDATSALDSTVRAVAKALLDAQSGLDSLTKAPTKPINDPSVETDIRISVVGRPVGPDWFVETDVLTATKFTGGSNWFASLGPDAHSALDSLLRQAGKNLTDPVSATDAFTRSVNKALADSQAGLDTLVKSVFKPVGPDWSVRTDTLATTWGVGRSLSLGPDYHVGVDVASPTPHVFSVPPGTGLAGLYQSSQTATWVNSGTGPELDMVYADASSSGWAVGFIRSYGGALIAPWYEINSNTWTVEQTSLSTTITGATNPDGWTHWLTQSTGANFVGSETYPYAFPTELAPTGTDFRRYYQAVVPASNSVDANGFNWTVSSCIYPGDPGFMVDTLTIKNLTSQTITLAAADSVEIALIGGLKTYPSFVGGVWTTQNAGYGWVTTASISTVTTGWPTTLTNGEPDFVYATPVTTAQSISVLAVKGVTISSLAPAWTSIQYEGLSTNTRTKFKIQGALVNFSGGAQQTIPVLRVLRRNLTATDAAAIAADYLYPGTPTVGAGTFTAFRQSERLYEFATTTNILSATFDFTPSKVTVRYKPVVKVTGWTDTHAPFISWGGAQLSPATDYRYTYDAGNNVLYVQLWFDVVASGAGTGQKNSATLFLSPPSSAWSQAEVDATSATDSARKAVGVPVPDSQSGQDARTSGVTKPAIDALSGVDAATKAALKPLGPDALSAIDNVVKGSTKNLGEFISALDVLTRVWQAFRTFQETFSETDTLSAGRALHLSFMDWLIEVDGVTAGKVNAAAWNLALTEAISELDTVRKAIGHLAVDASSASETLTKGATKGLGDSGISLDSLAKNLGRPLGDGTSATDAPAKTVFHLLFDQLSQTDQVIVGKYLLQTLFDAAGLTDSLPAFVMNPFGYPPLGLVLSLASNLLNQTISLTTGNQLSQRLASF